MPNRVILYERAGCHLCEEAAELLDEMIGSDRYDRLDIEADDDLLLRYGHRIPVTTVDDRERLELVITGADVRALVDALEQG
jgi:hypothetical protein